MEEKSIKPKIRRRRYDKDSSRADILATARTLFSSHGYGDVSLRQIAAAVGLDAAMIIRYFGSKDGLFAEAIQRPDLLFHQLEDCSRDQFGERYVRYILTLDENSREYHMLVALLRSATDKQAEKHLAEIASQPPRILADWLQGKDAEIRAALICAHLTGLHVMHRVFKNEALASHDVDQIVRQMAPTIQALVDC